jgi:hypothetical protein
MFLAAIIACVQKFDASKDTDHEPRPADHGWVRDQCREKPMSDPSFLKICALNISLEELFPTQKRESNEENT